MKRLLLLSLFVLASCAHRVVVAAPAVPVPSLVPETYDQFMFRTEGVDCPTVTVHDVGAPVPDCKKMHDAFDRGRTNLVNKGFPLAATLLKMSGVNFWQTQLVWNETEAFPRMKDLGAMAEYLSFANSIFFAFEECIEHEVQHWGLLLMDGQEARTPEAIALLKDADQSQWGYIWQVPCHNTSDDRFGDGTSLSISGRAGCVQPYSGVHQ